MYQDIPALGDSSTANVIDEERKMLIHSLATRLPDFDFINSPLHTLASVAAQGLGMNHPYHFPSGEKEKNPVGVAITAPVPLSYAVRGRAALRSILSIGEEEDLQDDSSIAQGSEQQIYAPISETRFEEHTAAFQRSHANGCPVQYDNDTVGNPRQPPAMIIRPITPSTLMALTEPCLMAWCSKSALDKRFPSVNVPVAAFDRTGRINDVSMGTNSWDY